MKLYSNIYERVWGHSVKLYSDKNERRSLATAGAFWDGSSEEIGETVDDPLHFTLYTAILSTLIQASVLIDQVFTTTQIPDCWSLFLEGPRMRTQKYSIVGISQGPDFQTSM